MVRCGWTRLLVCVTSCGPWSQEILSRGAASSLITVRRTMSEHHVADLGTKALGRAVIARHAEPLGWVPQIEKRVASRASTLWQTLRTKAHSSSSTAAGSNKPGSDHVTRRNAGASSGTSTRSSSRASSRAGMRSKSMWLCRLLWDWMDRNQATKLAERRRVTRRSTRARFEEAAFNGKIECRMSQWSDWVESIACLSVSRGPFWDHPRIRHPWR